MAGGGIRWLPHLAGSATMALVSAKARGPRIGRRAEGQEELTTGGHQTWPVAARRQDQLPALRGRTCVGAAFGWRDHSISTPFLDAFPGRSRSLSGRTHPAGRRAMPNRSGAGDAITGDRGLLLLGTLWDGAVIPVPTRRADHAVSCDPTVARPAALATGP